MTLDANKLPQDFKKAPLLDHGTYPARLVGVLDLGLQPQSYKGQEKAPVNNIMLTYELSTEFLKDENDEDITDKPRHISETIAFYPLSVEKATSTKRYLALDPEKKYGGDWSKVVGAPCSVTIIHNKSRLSDKIYANVSYVSGPMKGFPYPELKNDPKILDRDDPDMEVWNNLPEWIQKKIMDGLDFSSTKLGEMVHGKSYEEEAEGDYPSMSNTDPMDEPPF